MADTVLVIDDEPGILELLRFTLEQEGFQVEEATDGPSGLELAERKNPDLVLLDIMLPGMSGMDLCRELRMRSDVPIIMLTAKDSEIDQVLGLELGADDYVVKPFRPRELVARIHAVLRRVRSGDTAGSDGDESKPASSNGRLHLHGVELDPHRFEVRVNGRAVDCTPTEFDLLKELMKGAGRVLSREHLLQNVWGYYSGFDTRTVDVHIRRLRQKLGDDPENPRYIETLRGRGYRFKEA